MQWRPVTREQAWLPPPSLDDLLPEDHPGRFATAFADGPTDAEWADPGVRSSALVRPMATGCGMARGAGSPMSGGMISRSGAVQQAVLDRPDHISCFVLILSLSWIR